MKNRSRRQFLAVGAGALCAAPAASSATASQPTQSPRPAASGAPVKDVLDYARSFVTFVVKDQFNFARLQIDARTILFDRQGQIQDIFYRYASCKSEDTHGVKNLFMQPNYDFSGVFGRDSYVIFRVRAPHSDVYDERGKAKGGRFDDVLFDLRYERSPEVLKTNPEIVKATRAGLPLIGRTEFTHEASGRRALIEYPIKTMNVNLKRQIYQVDTGPLAFPDFDAKAERPIDLIQLAFVAYNRPDDAYFIVQRPAPIGKHDGKDVNIYHYSQSVHVSARNTLYAVR